MERLDMMKTHTSCWTRDFFGKGYIELFQFKINRSTKDIAMMVIQGFSIMTLRENHQRSILVIDIIQHDSDGQ